MYPHDRNQRRRQKIQAITAIGSGLLRITFVVVLIYLTIKYFAK